MTEPKIEELRQKADSKFALVMGAAKRTRQIIDFMNALGRGDAVSEDILPPDMRDIVDKKPVMIALKEIGDDRIKIIYPSGQEEEEEEAKQAIVEVEPEAVAIAEAEGEDLIKEAADKAISGKADHKKEEAEKPVVKIPEILKTKADKEKEKTKTKPKAKAKAEPKVKKEPVKTAKKETKITKKTAK